MKKLLLLIMTAGALVATAQRKDVQLTLLKPIDGQSINSGTPVTIEYELKNLGPDIVPADTLIVIAQIDGFQPFIAGAVTNRTLALNDTIKGVQSITLRYPGSFTNVSFCLTFTFSALTLDSNLDNNTSCATVNLPTSVAEIAKAAASLKVYPNPVSDLLNIEMAYNGGATFEAFDITGKKVSTTSLSVLNSQIDVSGLNTGIYLYQVKTNEGELIKSGKINVSR